jgi:F0F1-type ATP synthase membrane subunit a
MPQYSTQPWFSLKRKYLLEGIVQKVSGGFEVSRKGATHPMTELKLNTVVDIAMSKVQTMVFVMLTMVNIKGHKGC